MKKIKIVHVLNSLCIGGIESSVINICNNLDHEKYDVILLVLTNDNLVLKYMIKPNVNLIILPLRVKNSVFMSIFVLFFNLYKLIKVFKKNKCDIVHTHMYQYSIIPVLLAIRMSFMHMNHFHTIHTTGLHYNRLTYRNILKLKIESAFYKLCDTNLVCVSPSVDSNVTKYLHGYFGKRIIGNSIDARIFNGNKKCRSENEMFNLVYVSRLVDGKNHITLLKAFAKLVLKYSNINLILVGDGYLRQELEHYIIENNLSGNVEIVGYRDDVAKILSNCDIGVFPSEYEGFGIALVEMMAMRLAIVCSSIQTFKDLFDGFDGFMFFDVFDYDQLALHVEKLYLNRVLLKRMQDQAYEFSKKFIVENIIAQYNDYYISTLTK